MTLSVVRLQRIVDIIEESEEVFVSRLAKQLSVSEMTIRRDLRILEERGKVTRVHGGAVISKRGDLHSLQSRIELQQREKELIAKEERSMLEDCNSVFIGGGSTTLAFAQQAVAVPGQRFATNSIEIAQCLSRRGISEVFLLGGVISPAAQTLIGVEMLKLLENRVFDLAIIGVAAIDLQYGFLGPTEWHVQVARIVRQQARRLVILADHTKFDTTCDFKLFDLSVADCLITDREPTQPQREGLRQAGMTVRWPGLVAEAPKPRSKRARASASRR